MSNAVWITTCRILQGEVEWNCQSIPNNTPKHVIIIKLIIIIIIIVSLQSCAVKAE